MHSRPVSLASARSGRFRLFLSLALALGVLSACSDGDDDDDSLRGRTPGKARLEAELARGRVGEPMRFRCVAEDPRDEPLTYLFDWGDGRGEPTTSESVASGTPAEVTRTFTREGTFQARCLAMNPGGFQGSWSEGLSYTVDAAISGQDEQSVFIEVYGRGQVTSTPEGIDCPGELSSRSCFHLFPSGTRLGLRPTPEAGWRFVGWWGCENGVVPEELTLDRDLHCVARFAPEQASTTEWRRTGARLPQSPVWSPDGTRLAALDGSLGTIGNLLRIWDAASGRVVRELDARPGRFGSVAWHPTGPVLALGRADGSIALIDSTTGGLVREWPAHVGQVQALAWSPDGKRLASADDVSKAVRLWSADSGTSDGAPVVAVDKVRRLAWSPDGSRLALEAGAGIASSQWVEIHALGTTGPEELWTDAASFTWSPDGQRYAVGASGEARVYATATHQLAETWRGDWGLTTLLDWSRDGRWLAVGDAARALLVLEAATGAVVVDASEPLPPGSVTRGYDALRFHPSKPELVVMEDLPAALDVLTVDAAAHTVSRRELLPHGHEVEAVAWNPAGDRLASGGSEGRIRLWDGEGAPLRTLVGHGDSAVLSLAWDGTGTRLASGGADGRIRIWRAEDGAPVGEPLVHVTGQGPLLMQVNRVALSPDGSRVASVAESAPTESQRGTVKVWDVATGAELFRFTEAANWVRMLGWTPDGRYLVAAYLGAGWSLWDSQTGALRHVDLAGADLSMASALSPDGTRIAVAHRPGLSIHDVLTGDVVANASGGFDPYALAWSRDGRFLAGGGQGGLVFVWDVQANLASTVVGFHDGSVSAVSWRADGRVFTTGGSDTALTTWRPTP
ncbi:WD40 repeat domain-containing protein [Pyxidicoccus trucidator]|uniref:WD40 repeat domain-containing protein n=1 Tax=Pyxidicoccus trucidator TaxID=2709662 RepID=UPI0013DA1299|nr:WD40 repeat domain-containing protein [Pyxidicoccus trucidator]